MRTGPWLVLAAACGPIPVLKDPDSGSGPDDSQRVDDSNAPKPSECEGLTWKSVGQPFVQTWCLECHSVTVKGDDRHDAPESVNLDTRDLVESMALLLDLILDRDFPTMPPNGGPTAKEYGTFLLWLDCGAPE